MHLVRMELWRDTISYHPGDSADNGVALSWLRKTFRLT